MVPARPGIAFVEFDSSSEAGVTPMLTFVFGSWCSAFRRELFRLLELGVSI